MVNLEPFVQELVNRADLFSCAENIEKLAK